MLLILKKTIFDLIIPRYIKIWQSKEMSHDFVRGQSVAETCFWARILEQVTKYRRLLIVKMAISYENTGPGVQWAGAGKLSRNNGGCFARGSTGKHWVRGVLLTPWVARIAGMMRPP